MIKARKENRISQLELFEEFDKIQQKLVNESNEATSMGFASDREFAVFKSLEKKIDGDAKAMTHLIFKELAGELTILNWWDKAQVMKSMRVKIKGVLKGKVEGNDAQKMTVSLLDLIKRN